MQTQGRILAAANHKPAVRGFTLVEMLVVVALAALLLGLAAPVTMDAIRGNSPANVAGRIAAVLEQAKTAAVSRNTHVWCYIGPDKNTPTSLQVLTLESPDGTADPAPARWIGTRGQRFENHALDDSLAAYAGRPDVPRSERASKALWVRFSPSGEVHAVPADAASVDRKTPAVIPANATLARWIEIGLVPTRRGQPTRAANRDNATLQIAGLTGQIRRFVP